MNHSEALKLLELNNGATSEEINNAFRKMAKKYHPDRNKDNPDAELKFKEINTAYQFLNNPQSQQSHFSGHSGGFDVNLQDIFNQTFGFGRNPFQQVHNAAPQSVSNITISFAESVLGVEKELEIDQNTACKNCNGNGAIKGNTDCGNCQGKGHKQANFSRGNVQFVESCQQCMGTGKNHTPCNACNQKGFSTSRGNIKIGIPGGVMDGNVLRIPGSLIRIHVESDPDMSVDGEGNVVSDVEISLLNALKGISKPVRTVKGEMNLKIPPKIKNGNSVQVHGYGVQGKGSHIFNISVNYPENVEKLIMVLEE